MSSEQKINRRSALAGGLGLAFAGFTALEADSAEAQERRARQEREDVWKYVEMDPARVAELTYDSYHPWGCTYAVIKGGLKAYVEVCPEMAETVKAFPILAMRAGKTGFGAQESLCGTLNGAGMFMGLFVPDYADLCAMIVKLSEYYQSSPQPVFVPKDDKHPNFVKTISPSMMCKESKGFWLAQDPSEEHKKLRSERCMRLSASMMAKTVELLNEYFSSGINEEE